MNQATERNVREYIFAQFESADAQSELRALDPPSIDWSKRTRTTLETLIPALLPLAHRLVDEVPRRLNAANSLRDLVLKGDSFIKPDKPAQTWFASMKDQALMAGELVENIESQQVSAEIQRFIQSDRGLGKIVSANGNSIYPDLILKDRSYEDLPFQDRRNPIDGPCLQGKKNPRPSNVPDGCEIKTNKGKRLRVDAHGAHCGLHLGVTWSADDQVINLNGVYCAYVRFCDHKESGRNVAVTTVKHSFGHKLFISLL